jgi:hypothetical protein
MPKFSTRREFMFTPQQDITAYELAKLLPLILQKHDPEELERKLQGLPPEIMRHVTIKTADK